MHLFTWDRPIQRIEVTLQKPLFKLTPEKKFDCLQMSFQQNCTLIKHLYKSVEVKQETTDENMYSMRYFKSEKKEKKKWSKAHYGVGFI